MTFPDQRGGGLHRPGALVRVSYSLSAGKDAPPQAQPASGHICAPRTHAQLGQGFRAAAAVRKGEVKVNLCYSF